VSEWLDVMLEEIARKKREADEARDEQERREREPPPAEDHPK
jgi:hypothetical protein